MRHGWGRDLFVFTALFSLWDGDGMRDLLSWWGFGAVSFLLLIAGVVVLVHERRRLRALLLHWTVVPVALFIALCALSLLWSDYPQETAAGIGIQVSTSIVGVALVVARPAKQLVRLFALMVHVHLLLSLAFELVVPFLPGHRLAPFFTDYSANAPGAYFWSQGLLFTGQRIQGIVGNANLTCFIGLLGLIAVGSLIASRSIRLRVALPAIALDLLMMALTRSATVVVAAVAIAATALLVLAYRHARGAAPRIAVGAAAVIAIVAVALSSSRLSEPLLRLLGKGDDLTGRLEIWHTVGDLITARPVLGWGWIGWWAPWIPPFQNLVVRSGVEYLQAHNAFLDVELQLGIPGLIALALLVGGVVVRALRTSLVRAPFAMLPLLLTAALLIQALAESRLLIEGNWAMLVSLAVALPSRPVPRPTGLSPEDGTFAGAHPPNMLGQPLTAQIRSH